MFFTAQYQLIRGNLNNMTHTTNTLTFKIAAAFLLVSLAVLSIPAFTNAADYAYVDATGEVKSVTASDWMTAIATAMNIHINSGVFLLKSAADFAAIGDEVVGAK